MKPALAFALALALAAAAPAAAQEAPAAAPPGVTFAFEEIASLGPVVNVGDTPQGQRQAIPITGGTFAGPGIKGRILPGGADYQLVRKDGAVVIDADYFIQTDDGVNIHVRNVGLIVPPRDGKAAYSYCAPKFDAPSGKYGWLNDALFLSRISGGGGDKDHPAVKITIWKVG